MHLLFIEPNTESARELHKEFLAYRGVNWTMSHCQTYREALEMLDEGSFQSLLYSNDCSYEQSLLEIKELLRNQNCPPLIARTATLTPRENLHLIVDGSDDCFNRAEINGVGLMRQMRMAETRKSVYAEQGAKIASGAIGGLPISKLIQDAVETLPDDLKRNAFSRQLRVAHVSCRSSLIDEFEFDDAGIIVSRYQDLPSLLSDFKNSVQECDVLLVEQSVFEEVPESDAEKLERYLAVIPGVVLTLEKSDFSAIRYLERGYSDCLIADETSASYLVSSLKKSVIRRRRSLLSSLKQQGAGNLVNDRRATPRDSLNRRRHLRLKFEQPIVAIPVMPNGAPDLASQTEAIATDIGLRGLGVTMLHRDRLPRRNWVIGISQANGQVGYIGAYLRNVSYDEGRIKSGLVFHNDESYVLHADNLLPALNSQSHLAPRFSENVLDQWAQAGVLTRQIVRRAHTCPECEAISSVGTGCHQCGGYDLKFQELVHHFACAHVDEAHKFDVNGSIQCPKCLSKDLVAGADFEVIRSRYECQTCHCESDQTAEVGCCLNCQLRFPMEIAPEIEVYGYDVARLDVLALVDVARHTAAADSSAATL